MLMVVTMIMPPRCRKISSCTRGVIRSGAMESVWAQMNKFVQYCMLYKNNYSLQLQQLCTYPTYTAYTVCTTYPTRGDDTLATAVVE